MRIKVDPSIQAVIQSPNRGNMSTMKWVSALGLLGVAGFVVALKRDGKLGSLGSLSWLSEAGSSVEKLCLVPGLKNLGNNCFLNVILQALASCSYFESFVQEVVEGIEDQDNHFPLTVALAGLLQDLCLVSERRVVLSPRKVMHALSLYIQNFNLTNQQDAAEAFLHLLSSLREEFSDCYIPSQGSLADAFADVNCRILSPKRNEDQSEKERWQRHFFGPFDGILGSILMCQSCSSQVSLDYQFFHSLPLSPVQDRGSTIMFGCSLEDCLKQFVAAEQVENYHCSQCWHIAATRYLSAVGVDQTEFEKLRGCRAQDSCECRRLPHLEKLPWSNNYSRTLKQLSVSRCPKILCIHLQRASINRFGELVKLQGHISFPLILNLSPFVRSGVEIKDIEESWPTEKAKAQHKRPSPVSAQINLKYDAKALNLIYGLMANVHPKEVAGDELGCAKRVDTLPEELADNKLGCSDHLDNSRDKLADNELGCTELVAREELAGGELGRTELLDKSKEEASDELGHTEKSAELQGKYSRPEAKDCSNISFLDVSDDEMNAFCESCRSETYLYRLTSVVEHFGRVGSGHYTVYRSVRPESCKEDPDTDSEAAHTRWFCISDSQVFSVSENEVLGAEASLLFYERFTRS